jgi:hypothetical protein
MAAAKAKRRRATETGRTEFPVSLEKVLQDLLDPQDVEPGDQWSFTDAGENGLIICRDRVTTQLFDENGDPLPANQVLAGRSEEQ